MLYYWLKQIHIWSVLLSFTLFAARGAWVLSGRTLPRHPLLRALPHTVDTVLLGSALWLTTIIRQYPFVNDWLTAKVVLLVAYILLGSAALRRAPGRAWKAVFFAASLGVFAFMVSVARYRDPLGLAARWLG
jgi:uncharacterized membrane protein SirB2